MWSPFGQIADNANCTRTHIRFGSFHLQFMSPLHTRTHLAAWLGLETVIMCAAHSTRTLDSQYVTGPEPESCRAAIVRVRKVLRSYEQPACIVHCVIHCCLAAVRSAWSFCPFTGEPWASSHQLARKFLLWLCMCFILLSICWHLRCCFRKALKSLETRSILLLFLGHAVLCLRTDPLAQFD